MAEDFPFFAKNEFGAMSVLWGRFLCIFFSFIFFFFSFYIFISFRFFFGLAISLVFKQTYNGRIYGTWAPNWFDSFIHYDLYTTTTTPSSSFERIFGVSCCLKHIKFNGFPFHFFFSFSLGSLYQSIYFWKEYFECEHVFCFESSLYDGMIYTIGGIGRERPYKKMKKK